MKCLGGIPAEQLISNQSIRSKVSGSEENPSRCEAFFTEGLKIDVRRLTFADEWARWRVV